MRNGSAESLLHGFSAALLNLWVATPSDPSVGVTEDYRENRDIYIMVPNSSHITVTK